MFENPSSQTRTYLKTCSVAAFSVFLVSWACVLFKFNEGVVVSAFEILISFTMIVTALKRKKYLLVGALYCCFLLGDLAYGYFYYYLQIGYPTFLSYLSTEAPYCLAYILLPLIYLRAMHGSLRQVFTQPFAVIPLLIVVPLVYRFFSIHRIAGDSPPPYALENIALYLTFVGIELSLTVFIFSRGLFWSLFSLGMSAAQLAAWGIRVVRYTGDKIQFVSFENVWAFGLLLSALALLFFSPGQEKIDYKKGPSVVFSAKVIGLVIAFTGCILFAIGSIGDLKVVNWIATSSLMSVFLSGILAHYLWDRLVEYSRTMGNLLETELLDQNIEGELEGIPVEMVELYSKTSQLRVKSFLAEKEISTKMKIAREIENTTKQIVHDIRSPLAALNMIIGSSFTLSEDARTIVRAAAQRINDIANGLLAQGEKNKRAGLSGVQLLSSTLDSITSEKRGQFRSNPNIEIDLRLTSESYGLFTLIDLQEIKRTVSNLIDNAVEAVGEKGHVQVSLKRNQSTLVQIFITDNGPGIPQEILPKLGNRGVTIGKEGRGSGLGLYHARTTLESWGGSLKIDSEEGKGTSVILTLPQADPPKWFVEKIEIAKNTRVVILDDDTSIHQVWDRRFGSSSPEAELIHFSSPDEFAKWCKNHSADLYLFDYELIGFAVTGLDVIEKEKLHAKAILVTNRYEESAIQVRCETLGVGLIPKGLASVVPICHGSKEQ